MGAEEGGEHQERRVIAAEGIDHFDGTVRRPRLLGALGGQAVAPGERRRPAPLQALHLVAGEVVAVLLQRAGPLAGRMPAVHAPQFAVALARQVPLAGIADPVAGAGEPGQQRGLADDGRRTRR